MQPFAAPRTLPSQLERARAYWQGLLRGGADIPFWDDLQLTDLGDLVRDSFTLDAFELPLRFRFAQVGEGLKQSGGADLEGVFLDEAQLSTPFEFLLSQASATVEGRCPTLHKVPGAYSRLLLPMWGEGRVGLLLGVVAWD
ncbi:hypothetical protein QO010_002157 [Caulobacter ginsengisoli]|uniref:PAS domain-containing protein n=1 Tax=Caulobacter ginsengisoli TaxID=400775 RepID=A0ABU0IQT4_9CAUL|nr:hypothetical protein [Caulobacter ginsengisoli]MDQ0464376.1 hypothetical protein [Caulobacter ginsengisoli]